MNISARTALVTGANRGLGLATANELAARGIHVVLTARDTRAAEEAAGTVGAGTVGIALDVTDASSIEHAYQLAGPVDILVSNAGVLLDGGSDPLTVSPRLVADTFRTNLYGSWLVAQRFIPRMLTRRWGRVVFVSSGTGSFSNGLFTSAPSYSLSKTALNGLTTMLAKHTSGTGVLVNAVNPGMTRTRMMPHAPQDPAVAAGEIADVACLPDDGPTGQFLRGGEQLGW
ncbi:SDR family NAD(P)-dependent oxidoreductase [Tamaricihabitans halophyticus]|nr:SDR family NAD(P)-dependent oxidoreductase [Tamaricihabitans halophyticus]